MTPNQSAMATWSTRGRLSTAGAGVRWLHVRVDDRPKYYHYRPYPQAPGQLASL